MMRRRQIRPGMQKILVRHARPRQRRSSSLEEQEIEKRQIQTWAHEQRLVAMGYRKTTCGNWVNAEGYVLGGYEGEVLEGTRV